MGRNQEVGRVWMKWVMELSEKGLDKLGRVWMKWEMELRSGKDVDEVGNGMKKWESSGRSGKRVEEVVWKGDWRRREGEG